MEAERRKPAKAAPGARSGCAGRRLYRHEKQRAWRN